METFPPVTVAVGAPYSEQEFVPAVRRVRLARLHRAAPRSGTIPVRPSEDATLSL
jgi:hypothetical protein